MNVEITSCHGNTAELQWEGGPENWATVTRYIVQFNSSVEPVRWHDYYEQFPAGERMRTHAWSDAQLTFSVMSVDV